MDKVTRSLPSTDSHIERQLTNERLILMTQQAGATCVVVNVALIGTGILFYEHLSLAQLMVIPLISVIYLLRTWIARHIFAGVNQDSLQPVWPKIFAAIAITSGIAWGVSAAYWLLQDISGGELFIAIVVGGVISGAITSLGVSRFIYPLYILGILVPVSIAFWIRGNGIGPTLAILTLIYAIYLIASASNFRARIDQWSRLSLENRELARRLGEAMEISEQRLENLGNEVDERRHAETVAENHRTTLSNLLGNLPGMAYRASYNGRWKFQFISEGCSDIFGMSADELIELGKESITQVLKSDDRRLGKGDFRFCGSDTRYQQEYTLVTPHGEQKRVVERGCRVYNEIGHLIAIDGFITDISEQFRLSSELSRLERHDSLTGIYNRGQFEVIVQNSINGRRSSTSGHVLLYLDLDQFNFVNNTCGHAAGDALLKQVATTIRTRLRHHDTFARLGSDEFGILLEDCNLDEAKWLANDLRQSIENFRFVYEDRSISLTASIGIASTNDGLTSLQDLLTAAEVAAHAAKENGRNQVHLYQSNDVMLARRTRESYWAIEIPEALNNGRMCLEWQKIIPISKSSASLVWYEVLVRMLDSNNKMIYPRAFFPAAERYNLATQIDTWVVETLLQLIEYSPKPFDNVDTFFVNLSGQSMGQADFVEYLSKLLERTPEIANRICFEITETAAIANKNQALKMMQRLHKIGCRIFRSSFLRLMVDLLRICGKNL